ncbi:AcrR family transcriptional regulator [Rhodococcus erythropolis]|uniref:TetR/AcrR family transcriptional regulator n=1 Tax=Rhodococcus erythropolis TaxID=1833 RepID=UPI002166D030|nr:TetR/AcrR family transcriptional regulator [Rhodococcus erythropolis]MCS4255690.1 AcrR family transcriptional regulator [Rhodococcus erythropolis]MCW2425203.1 AcrR family transcriptional regulator [Rhodococcus erythropolis]
MRATAEMRPGGRSARIHQAVLASTRKLLEQCGRDNITVPLIAIDAGVTPSTIYRRWGSLNTILAEIAIEQMLQTTTPQEKGSLRGDLTTWAQDFLEVVSTPTGKSALLDVVRSDGTTKTACAHFCRNQIDEILDRWPEGVAVRTDSVIDRVIAPIVYRVIFNLKSKPQSEVSDLVNEVLLSAPHFLTLSPVQHLR